MFTESSLMAKIAAYLVVDAVWWIDAGQPVYRGITRHELWGRRGEKRGRLCAFDLPARSSDRAASMLCRRGMGGASDLEILRAGRRSW